jgi:hypothetical protein
MLAWKTCITSTMQTFDEINNSKDIKKADPNWRISFFKENIISSNLYELILKR